jgi:hypothetical protein
LGLAAVDDAAAADVKVIWIWDVVVVAVVRVLLLLLLLLLVVKMLLAAAVNLVNRWGLLK